STTSHTKQNMMDTDANSNATVKGIEIPHHLYSSVVKNKDQIIQEMESILAHWIEIKEPVDTSTSTKPLIPNNLDTLWEKLQTIKDALQIPITEYNKLNDTLEWL
ncbi:9609_t:CDS:2, partial [Gigaspora margarita]